MYPIGNSANGYPALGIVDLHAITVPQDPATLRRNVREMAVSLLACGIDPDKCILFRQSKVPQHSELAWLLFCRTPVAWLSRMHQWKSKLTTLRQANSATGPAAPSSAAAATLSLETLIGSTSTSQQQQDDPTQGLYLGLFAYPVLQAADILIYRATQVPVGEDQLQHLELTADVAKSFNSHYQKQVFPVPRALIPTNPAAKRIMSLRVPTSKMSKSDPSEASRIQIDDTPDAIRVKIRKATVDSERGITYDPAKRPGIANLLHILSCMESLRVQQQQQQTSDTENGISPEDLARQYANFSNKEFKDVVTESVVEALGPIRERIEKLKKEKGYVEEVLKGGEEKAQRIAERTLRDVKKVIGLL
ncbi:hypothetical protein HK102_006580 [Quaeritorhiza haematococci]|nr:hypothetical protein HK102_006580 [Quaeritorhiza haematococci]